MNIEHALRHGYNFIARPRLGHYKHHIWVITFQSSVRTHFTHFNWN